MGRPGAGPRPAWRHVLAAAALIEALVAAFVGASRADASGTAAAPPGSAGAVAAAAAGGGFEGLTPARLLDTRPGGTTIDGQGSGGGAVGPGGGIHLQVAGRGGVPATGAGAVAVNLTVTEPTLAGHVTVWPSDQPQPTASSINMVPGQTVANGVISKLAADGTIALYNATGSTHLIVDVLGWFPASAFTPLNPARVLDTRPGGITADGQASGAGALGTDATTTLQVLGRVGLPTTGVGAVAINLTIAAPTVAGYVTVWPTGQIRPNASSINMAPDQTVANGVISKVGPDGTISIYNATGSTHVIVDVLGWFPETGSLQALTPARLADTRPGGTTSDGQFSGYGPVGTEGTTVVTVIGRGGVPATGVGSVAINLTVTEPTAEGYLSVWPTTAPRPNASNVNVVPGLTVANGVISKVGPDGSVSVYNATGSTHVIVDVVGWFPDPLAAGSGWWARPEAEAAPQARAYSGTSTSGGRSP